MECCVTKRIDKNKDGQARKISSQALLELIDGLGKLVEGQRQFADEFGLPYGRLFHDGFEAFKDGAISAQLLDWISSDRPRPDQIGQLFSDLLKHQLALVEALAALDSSAAEKTKKKSLSALFRPLSSGKTADGAHRRFMEVTAPAFIAAYARARELGVDNGT